MAGKEASDFGAAADLDDTAGEQGTATAKVGGKLNDEAPRPKDQFCDESRYMRDENDRMLHKWKVEYASRGGGGRAMCRDLECLERHEQAGVRTIEKGELRIGRRVLMDKDGGGGHLVMMWYHARCIFNTFLRSRKVTRVIESAEDLEGFEDVQLEDQAMLRRFIDGSEDVRGARGRAGGKRSLETPEKGSGGLDEPASKRQNSGMQSRVFKKGDRAWTFCRVRPPASHMPGPGAEYAVKSPKPELGMIREEEKEGHFILQFESAEHEKERIEKYGDRRHVKIRAWLRYPRIFEGKKQRIPTAWIQWNRPPPRLCGCTKQAWGHECDCGIACTRGSSVMVWGVCQ